MSSAAKLAANAANARHSTGPRTEAGKAASARNAIKSGLFSNQDCIRPGEESAYSELEAALERDLQPLQQLEFNLVDEIRRAMWRLRRCGQVEAAMAQTCAEMGVEGTVLDPMQIEATAKLQFSVDRARSQCHRLLHKCTAELRKLQTERHVRNETTEEGTEVGYLGLAEMREVRKSLDEMTTASMRQNKLDRQEDEDITKGLIARDGEICARVLAQNSRRKNVVTIQTQTPRNAACPCNSGLKYKRCCGKDAAPLLN